MPGTCQAAPEGSRLGIIPTHTLYKVGMTDNGESFQIDESTPFREWTTLTTDDGPEVRVRLYGPLVRLESHLVPARLEIKTGGAGEPEIYARVEVDENRSKLAELRFVSTDRDARGIRQSDLREI